MCIAFYAPPNTTIDRATLKRCFESNPHGAGFIIPTKNGPQVKKGFFKFKEWADCISHRLRRNKHGVIGHCRIATHGGVDELNCHPHIIASHNSAFVHNGIISQHCVKDSEFSDSILFGREVLEALPKNWNEVAGMKEQIEEYIGKHNKIIYAFDNGSVEIINKDTGIWDNGVWYSNSSFRESYYEHWDSKECVFCSQCNADLDEGEQLACEDIGLLDYVCRDCIPWEVKPEYEQFVTEYDFEASYWEKYANGQR